MLPKRPADRRDQPVVAWHRVFACIEQHETACAIGVFCHARLKTRLTKQRTLLVTDHRGDRHSAPEQARIGFAEHAGSRHDRWKQRARYIEQFKQRVVPLPGVQVEQHRARGVARVGRVYPSGGQVPGKPRVNCPEGQFTPPGPLAGARDIVEQPFELRGRKIGVQHQASPRLDVCGTALRKQGQAAVVGAAILPDTGVGQRLARCAIPENRGFALVGDGDRPDLRRSDGFAVHALRQHAAHHRELRTPDFRRIVFNPARAGEYLGELLLRRSGACAAGVHEDRPRTGRALV